MKHRTSQMIMIWFLPLIVIGGLFFPILGYIVLAMMAYFITTSFFKSRSWCWNLCPRGAFLDIAMPKLSPGKKPHRIFSNQVFRWLIFAIVIAIFAVRIINTGGNLIAIGAVFVGMCLVTTIIAVILAVLISPRAWCAICPMGTLQEKLGSINKKGESRLKLYWAH